jgi:hypothetical protein
VAEGTPEEVARELRSYTGHYLAPLLTKSARSKPAQPELVEGSSLPSPRRRRAKVQEAAE